MCVRRNWAHFTFKEDKERWSPAESRCRLIAAFKETGDDCNFVQLTQSTCDNSKINSQLRGVGGGGGGETARVAQNRTVQYICMPDKRYKQFIFICEPAWLRTPP